MDLTAYQDVDNLYSQLSLPDLLDARDQYHIHLMRQPNVVATAVGRYRIRNGDSWPSENGPGRVHGTGVRTLDNSAVRPYSWPAILVFVSQWVPEQQFTGKAGQYEPNALIPKTLYMPDGRKVPVCVIEAPKDLVNAVSPKKTRFPMNKLGGGYPITVHLQGREHFATIACLVSDGHKAFALTNRHVTGEAGEVLYSIVDGRERRVGVTAEKQLTRIPFRDLYPGWAGKDVYVNLDVGLVDVDDLNQWTAEVRNVGVMGPMVDLSAANISLSLIGAHVTATGAASGRMHGEIHALFYRYKSQGGFEYVADLFIGPRTPKPTDSKKVQTDKLQAAKKFATHPGDSGSLWLLEAKPNGPPQVFSNASAPAAPAAPTPTPPAPLPLAMQWGENTLYSGQPAVPQSYALATFVSRVCALLELDPIRDWRLDQPDTWGAVGHFSIAARTLAGLSGNYPKLSQLMTNNLKLFSHDDATILNSDFKGMGAASFVPLADVPDFYWKHGTQGHARHFEGPNHFADMDQPRPSDQQTLLSLCLASDSNINPAVWSAFYDSVTDLLSGDPIEAVHRGLLPFRVWQIFEAMVEFASAAKTHDKFVCAAGVLTHYVGDACQPLHISYLHDGDPLQATEHTVNHVRGKKAGTSEVVRKALGEGVHSMYEDSMVNNMRQEILNALAKTPPVKKSELIKTGFDAAKLTVNLMSQTFDAIPPKAILDAFLDTPDGVTPSDNLYKLFGKKTLGVMKAGTHLAAVLWESAWALGNGESVNKSTKALTEDRAMEICADDTFVPSCSIDQVSQYLTLPAGMVTAAGAAPTTAPQPAPVAKRPRAPAKKAPAKKALARKAPAKRAASKTAA